MRDLGLGRGAYSTPTPPPNPHLTLVPPPPPPPAIAFCRPESLRDNSTRFETTARRLKRKMWWKNTKVRPRLARRAARALPTCPTAEAARPGVTALVLPRRCSLC